MPSSISSSSVEAELPRPIRPVLLSLVLAASALAAASLLEYLDPVRDRDNSRLRAAALLGPNTRMVSIGTSHVLCGIDPAIVWSNAVNIATPGADYEALLLILRQHWSALTGLEIVVLEVDNICISNLGFARRDFSDLYDFGVPRTALPLNPFGRLRQAIIEHPLVAPIFFSTRLTPWAWLRRPTAERYVRGPGFEVYTGRVSAVDNGLVKIRAHEAVLSQNSAARNRIALEQILDLFTERQIPVILVTLPHDALYTANAGPEWLRTFDETLKTARDRLGARFVWWNLDRHPAFAEEDFNDGHHVNERGAQKLSHLLRGMLEEELARRGL